MTRQKAWEGIIQAFTVRFAPPSQITPVSRWGVLYVTIGDSDPSHEQIFGARRMLFVLCASRSA